MSSSPSIFRITFIGLTALVLAMGIGRFAFTPLLPMMQADGLLNISEGGLLAAVHFFGYWLGAMLMMKLALPPKLTLRLSLLAIGISTIAMGMTDDSSVWMISRWLSGVCSAWTLMLVSNHYVKYLAEHNAIAYQGWIFSGVGAGIAIAGFACLLLMVYQIDSALSWQIIGMFTLLISGVIGFSIGVEVPSSRPSLQHRKSSHTPLDWRIIIAYGVMGIGYIIPATYLPAMAREIVQSPLIFGWSWPVFGLAAFISTILAARFQRHYSNRQLWSAGHIVMATGMLLPVVYPHILSIIAAGFCVGGTFMIITMTGMKEVHRTVPAQDVMRHIAAMTAAFATGQMIGPLFASAIYSITQGFALSLVCTSLALVITAITLQDGFSRARVAI